VEAFKDMSDKELINFCKNLYEEKGMSALLYKELSKQGTLYPTMYSRGFTQKKIIKVLALDKEYKEYKKENKRWSWSRIIEIAKEVKEKEGFLPPAGWFQRNGYAAFVQAVYSSGYTWEKLREEFDDFTGSLFVESRNRLRWRSHPEASFSNFLYARGIEHKRGERYPKEYAEESKANYAYFDLHFLDKKNNWIDVEVWGDKPHGHDEVEYSERRKVKEKFNKDNPHFLGIHYNDCFDEDHLSKILKTYIGECEAFQFDRPTDKIIPTTHWSNTDELLGYCRELASSMPNKEFPTEAWLRKRGKWSEREGDVYNTLAIYIQTWFGGMRKLRKLLGQEDVSPILWNRESALEEYKRFYDEHGITPGQGRHKNNGVSEELYREAARIDNAILKYAGGTKAVNKLLGIKINLSRKWSKEKIREGYKKIIDRWEISPNQLINDHRTNKISLPENEYKALGQLIDAANREFGGSKKVLEILNFKPPSRKRNRKTNI